MICHHLNAVLFYPKALEARPDPPPGRTYTGRRTMRKGASGNDKNKYSIDNVMYNINYKQETARLHNMCICIYIYIRNKKTKRKRASGTAPLQRGCAVTHLTARLYQRSCTVLLSFQQPTFQRFQMGIGIQMPCVFDTCSCIVCFNLKYKM